MTKTKLEPLVDEAMDVYYGLEDTWGAYAKSKKWRGDVLRGMTYLLRVHYSDKEIREQIALHAKEDRCDNGCNKTP